MKKKWQVICAFIGIFLAGAVVGSVVSVRIAREAAKRRTAPDQFSPQVMRHFVEELNLTPEQTKTIQVIVTKYAENIKRVRRDAFKETSAIFEKMDSEVGLHLTDEQKLKLKEMQVKQRQKARDWMAKHDRPPRRDKSDAGAPPPPADGAPDAPPPPPKEP